jgi:hypothetical protein
MNPQIKKAVSSQVNYVGDSEYLLAVSRVEDPNDVNAIVEFIQGYRKPFESGKIISNGAAAFATQEVWQVVSAESDNSAKRELLRESALLVEVDELTRKADEAKRLADERTAELNRLYREYAVLPDKIRGAQSELIRPENR